MPPNGFEIGLGRPATVALGVEVVLARLGDAPQDLDVVLGLRELLDQLPGLLAKSLVDHAQLIEVPVRLVTLARLLVKLQREAGLEPGVGLAQLGELAFEAANRRPRLTQIPLVRLPLSVEPFRPRFPVVDELVELLHHVGHLDLDGEDVGFGHCTGVGHQLHLLLAGVGEEHSGAVGPRRWDG